MKLISIFAILLLSVFQTKDTPDFIGTRSIDASYFWNNDRNLKLLKSKSNTLVETIKNGYYGDMEYLTFVDKKISSIKYVKNGITDSVKTINNGNGYLTTKNDTIYIQNGKLNGESYFYSFYVLNNPTVKSQKPIFAKDQQRYVMTFKDNFLKSMLVYRKGILIYESYFNKYDFIKASLAKGKNDSDFQDSILKVYRQDGSLRISAKYKNGRAL